MEEKTRFIEVELENGKVAYVEATVISGVEAVAFETPSFKGVTDAIEEISKSIAGVLEKVKPRKASVEFGVEVGLESGKLTALLVKGTGTASMKITLEWGE